MFTYNDPTRPTVFITPAYPAFLAVLMKIIGPGFAMEQTARILQAVMVTAALYVLYLIGRKLFSEKVAVVAVGLTAFYIPLWLVSNLLLTEAMFVLALVLMIYAALLAMEDPTPKRALLFGLAWVYHYAILLPSFWGMWKARKREGAQAVVLLLAYFSLLHMIYLAHGRYSAPLMLLMALFAAYAFAGRAKTGPLRVK